MYYTVAEVAERTGLSKTSIYNRLQLDEFKRHTTKKQGITYITENGLKLIYDSINNFTNDFESTESRENDCESENQFSVEQLFITHLQKENDNLWDELQEKNHQINKLSQLVENGQVLLKEKPTQEMQLLEERCMELDEKLVTVKEKMAERNHRKNQEEEEKKPSFFARIFHLEKANL